MRRRTTRNRPRLARAPDSAEAAFRYGGMVNWQVQFLRCRDAVPMTRDYMYEEEARLRDEEEPPRWRFAAE